MTADREREGMDRLRVGGWLPPAKGRIGHGAPPAETSRVGPAHAAPEDEDAERREPPAPYEAPPVDLDEPVPALRRRAAAGRSRAVEVGASVVASVGRYVYQGRRRIGEMMAHGPGQQRARFGLAGVALVALAIAAVALLSPDGGPGGGQGLALPTGPPQVPPPSADQEIGSASPEPPPSPSPSRTKPPRSPSAPPPRASHPGPLTLTYEAEDAALIGGAQVLSLRRASGGQIVHNIGDEPGRRAGLVSFTQVDVPTTNRYALTVDYVTGEDRTAILTINGDSSVRLRFPSSGDWDEIASRTFTISLVGGRNNLTFGNPDDWAPRLDRIHLLG
jgi:hypothetical protein